MHIVATGVATLDLVAHVTDFPEEDSEQRCRSLQWRCGGNAANTAQVLARLGHEAGLLATLSDTDQGNSLRTRLQDAGVNLQGCAMAAGQPPTSMVLLADARATRTIVHYRDLPELQADQFEAGLPADPDWLHFEGRNPVELVKMLRTSRDRFPNVTISVEIEKTRPGLDELQELADVLLFSAAYARSRGHETPQSFLESCGHLAGRRRVCAWGEQGAAALDEHDQLIGVPAHPVKQLRDTLAAGDVFNAGMIHALATGKPVAEGLAYANRLAAWHCEHEGLDWALPQ